MVIHKSQPQFQIVTSYGGSNYTFTNDQAISGTITRLENGFDTATLLLNDYRSLNWLSKVDAESNLTINFKDGSDSSWVTEFDGPVRYVDLLLSMNGDLVQLKCDGAGYGIGESVVAHEYGAQSLNPTLDTILEILTTADHGILSAHVNHLFDHVTDEYNYTAVVDDIAGTINYLYFPYIPASKAIKDVCDVVQAIKGANAGPHWIVTPGDKFLLSTVGSHSAAVIAEGWTTYFNGSQADSTLEQAVDFTKYDFQKLSQEASWIVYHGACRKPADGDKWTESNSASWQAGANVTMSDDAASFKMPLTGGHSIKAERANNGAGIWFYWWYPSAKNLALDITTLGGQNNVPSLNFWATCNSQVTSVNWRVKMHTGTAAAGYDGAALGDYYSAPLMQISQADVWQFFTVPIGPYWRLEKAADFYTPSATGGWVATGSPNWANINAIEFSNYGAASGAADVWIDGLFLSGWVLRGAYDSTGPLAKIKVITDNVAKDDTLKATDDSGTIAQLAKTELYRCKNKPILGWVETPVLKDLLPGQLIHTHAKKKTDGSFNIDKDLRVTKLIHSFSTNGVLTTTYLTDDVTNSYARTSFNDMNTVLKASRQFEDRQAASIKIRDIDITQNILLKAY